jgi:hypothetical protein
VGFFQIATRLSLYVKTPWPSAFQEFMSAFELLNFEFIPWQSVACVASIDFYTKFWYALFVNHSLVLPCCHKGSNYHPRNRIVCVIPPVLLLVTSFVMSAFLCCRDRFFNLSDHYERNKAQTEEWRSKYWRLLLCMSTL